MTIQTVQELCEFHTSQTILRTDDSPHARQVARLLGDFSGQHGELAVEKLNSDHIRQWLDEHDWSPLTKLKALQTIRAAFRETGQSFDVSIGIPALPQQRNLISSKSHRTLIDAAAPDLANVLHALYYTGARSCELINLDIKHVVDRPEGMFWNRPVDKMGYGNPIAVPTVLEESVQRLGARRKDSAPVFTRADGARWSYSNLRHALLKVCQKCGVEGVTFKDYRYSFYCRLLEAGTAPRIIGAILGHAPQSMANHYFYLSPKILLDAVNRAADIPGGLNKAEE